MMFSQILIGDVFNNKEARWVKISPTQSICVMSSIFPIGQISDFTHDEDVVVLYSTLLRF